MGRMLFAGSPDTVVERLRVFQSLTGVGVVDLVFSSGQIAVEDERRSIELFGREVFAAYPFLQCSVAIGVARWNANFAIDDKRNELHRIAC
jgi:hypothetical protein